MTWSILVRDPATGALGAAVASRFFAVGAICIHVEGGVAALATQALVNPMYAVAAMPRLRSGETPQDVLTDLVGADPGAGQRQFHVLGANGDIAQHTGQGCVAWAGHVPDTTCRWQATCWQARKPWNVRLMRILPRTALLPNAC